MPGVSRADDPSTAVWSYVVRGLELLVGAWPRSLPLPDAERGAAHLAPGERSLRDWLARPFEELVDLAHAAGRRAGLAGLVAAIALAGTVESVSVDHLPGVHDRLLRLLAVLRRVGARRCWLAACDVDDRVRRIGQLVEIVVAAIRGIVSDGVLTRASRRSTTCEFLEWLRTPRRIGRCRSRRPSCVGGYDLAFAFRGGDPARPSMAAGVALENAARLFFTYKGAMFWKMQAGMGDVVFAPLYQVLRRRGVRFRFFHRVTALRLAADRRSIGAHRHGPPGRARRPRRRVRAARGRARPAVLAGRAALGAGRRAPTERGAGEPRVVLGAVAGRRGADAHRGTGLRPRRSSGSPSAPCRICAAS